MSLRIDNSLVENMKSYIIGLNRSDENNSKIFQEYLKQAQNASSQTVDDQFYKNFGVLLCKNLWWESKLTGNKTLMISAHAQAEELRKNGASINFYDSTFVDEAYKNKFSNATASYSQYNSEGKIVSEASKLLNIPYVYGGNDLNTGIDCSRFVQATFSKLGVNLPRTTYEQINIGTPISLNNLKAGDVVFFDPSNSNTPSHVGIYAGNGRLLHASSSKGKVVNVDFNEYIKHVPFYGARRFIS